MAGIMFGTEKGAVGFLATESQRVDDRVYIDLPADFDGASSIYYFAVSGSRILFSSDVTDIGVWEYDVLTNTSTQIYNVGENWQNFQMVGENCLISSNVATGILFFNSYDNQISSIHNSGSGWDEFLQVGDNYLIIGRNATGVLFYNSLFNTIEVKYMTGSWNVMARAGVDVLIGSNNSTGMLLYNGDTTAVTLIAPDGTGWIYFHSFGTKCFASSNSYTGIYKYDSTTRSLSRIYENNYTWNYCVEGVGCYLFSSSINRGIVEYDVATNTSAKIFDEGYKFGYAHKVGNKLLLSAQDYPYYGVLLHDKSNGTITKIHNTGYDWKYSVNDGQHAIITSNLSNGILYFDGSAITMVYNYGTNYDILTLESGVCSIESSEVENNNRKLNCNLSNGTITLVSYAIV